MNPEDFEVVGPDKFQVVASSEKDFMSRQKRRAKLLDELDAINEPKPSLLQTIPKSYYAFREQGSRALADGVGTLAKLLEKSAPMRAINWAQEQAGQEPTSLAPAVQEFYGDASDAYGELKDLTPGHRIPAEIVGGLGSLLPSALSAPVGLGIPMAAMQGYGAAERQAKEYLIGLGVPEEDAKKLANKMGVLQGAVTGAVTKYTPEVLGKIPGLKNLAGGGVEQWTSKVLTDYLKRQAPIKAAALRIIGNAGSEATEETIDELLQAAISKKSYDPTLTWQQAMEGAAIAGASGAIGGGGLTGLTEAADLSRQKAAGRSLTEKPDDGPIKRNDFKALEGRWLPLREGGFGTIVKADGDKVTIQTPKGNRDVSTKELGGDAWAIYDRTEDPRPAQEETDFTQFYKLPPQLPPARDPLYERREAENQENQADQDLLNQVIGEIRNELNLNQEDQALLQSVIGDMRQSREIGDQKRAERQARREARQQEQAFDENREPASPEMILGMAQDVVSRFDGRPVMPQNVRRMKAILTNPQGDVSIQNLAQLLNVKVDPEAQKFPGTFRHLEPYQADPEPTEAQKEAGNYKKGHIKVHGFDVSIENPAGGKRRGQDKNGKKWEVAMPAHYGYIRGTEGKDKDHLDVYVGPNEQSDQVFIVDQIDPASGEFDEHKILMGFDSYEEAKAAYDGAFSDGSGPARSGAVTALDVDAFKKWMKEGNTKKPLSYRTAPPKPKGKPMRGIRRMTQPVPEPEPDNVPEAEPQPEPEPTPEPEPEPEITPEPEPEPIPEPEPTPEPPPQEKPEKIGQNNVIFTQEQFEKDLQALKEKLKNLNVGVDPEFLAIGTRVAGYYIESGIRAFPDFAAKMMESLGEKVRPYLKSFYMGVYAYPGFDNAGMTNPSEVMAFQFESTPEPEITNEEEDQEKPKADEGGEVQDEEPIQDTPEKVQASIRLAKWVSGKLKAGEKFSSQELFDQADQEFNGTQTDGVYSPKDAYDSMEMGVNNWIFTTLHDKAETPDDAKHKVEQIREALDYLPTQTKRTTEQDEFQQFSTPPHLAFAAAWTANIKKGETVLEPSAGLGGLAVFAKKDGAKVVVNELSPRRRALLEKMNFDQVFGENAEQINNVLPDYVQPDVVLMNPPFSATAGRIHGMRRTSIGAQHVEQALKRLKPGGRLVAIVGEGMAHDKAAFKDWWARIGKKYNVRANVGVSGQEYRKYGTTFDNQVLVIDKTEPTGQPVITGKVDKVEDLIDTLAGIRNDNERLVSRPDRESKPGSGKPKGAGVSGGVGNKTGPKRPPRNPTDALGGEDDTGLGGNQPDTDGGLRNETVQGQKPGDRPNSSDPRPERTGGVRGNAKGSRGGGGNPSDNTRESPAAVEENVEVSESKGNRERIKDNAVFEDYETQVEIKGAVKHPTPLSESAAMATVTYPKPDYKPSLNKGQMESGRPSAAQLENVLLAGEAHSKVLPNGQRMGYFIGDGTGVGKGITIASIIQDNWNKGRKRAMWISKNDDLLKAAQGDLEDVGMSGKLVFNQQKFKLGKPIEIKEGILFTNYSKLRIDKTETINDKAVRKSRVQQLIDWFGADYDGLIIFDESHNMGNAVDQRSTRGRKKASAQALAAMELQNALPNARVVYVSATGATEVNNLAYASRLGLWGQGTPFADVNRFIASVGAGGVGAMEVIAKDLKSMGLYMARSLSWEGVESQTLEHKLNENQREMYDTLAEAWQIVLQDVDVALDQTNAGGKGRANAMSAFWGAHQRFFNQILTSLQMETALKEMRKDLEKGESVIIQLVNTNEAAQNRSLDNIATDEDATLEDLDISPTDILVQFLQRSFPITVWTETTDANGNIKHVPLLDSEGNQVIDREAVAMRDALITKVKGVKTPEGPLDLIISEFGADNVAEVTGRTQRVVYKQTAEGKQRVIEKRSTSHRAAEAQEFRDKKRRILVFSEAGGTGQSFHSDRRYINQERRNHYLVQAGWRADIAVQGLGRSHRSNQVSAPFFKLITTDIPGHKRFISTIARRLEQLGALTKGQRQTTSGGVFSAKDNLESTEAKTAKVHLLRDIAAGQVEGVSLEEFQNQSGIMLVNEDGIFVGDNVAITQFLNRMLSLKLDMQETVFREFNERLDAVIEFHKQQGTLDEGLTTIKGTSIRAVNETELATHERTGTPTKLLTIESDNPAKFREWDDSWIEDKFVVNKRSNMIWRLGKIRSKREVTGATIEYYEALNPRGGREHIPVRDIHDVKFEELTGEKAREKWSDVIIDSPKTKTTSTTILTGTLLPYWDRLTGDIRLVRAQLDTGDRILGITLNRDQVNGLLRAFGQDRQPIQMREVLSALDEGKMVELANRWKILVRRVSGEPRYELKGPQPYDQRNLEAMGLFTERINWDNRYFIPIAKAEKVLKELFKSKPPVDIVNDLRGSLGAYAQPAISSTITGDGIEGARQIIEQSNLAPQAKATALAMLDTPVLKDLNWDKFRLEIKDWIQGGFQGTATVSQGLIELANQADASTFPHEIFHFLYELLPDAEKVSVDRLRKAEINARLSESTDPAERMDLQMLLDEMGSEDFVGAGINRDLYYLSNPSEYLAHLGGESFTKKVWSERNQTEAQKLIGKVKDWIRGLLDALKRAVGFKADIDQIARELLAGKYRNTPTGGSILEARRGSLAAVSTLRKYTQATDFDPKMSPEEKRMNRAVYLAENFAAVGMVGEEFAKLSEGAQRALGAIRERMMVIEQAKGQVGDTAFVSPSLREMAANLSQGNPHDHSRVVFSALVNIMSLRDSEADLEEKLEEAKKAVKQIETMEVGKDRSAKLHDAAIVVQTRRRMELVNEREAASKAGNARAVDLANREIEWWKNRENAIKNVLSKLFTDIPKNADVFDYMKSKAGKEPMGASKETVDAVIDTLSRVDDLADMVKSLENPKLLEKHKAAKQRVKDHEDAIEFLRNQVFRNKTFHENYQYAAEVTGSKEVVEKVNDQNQTIYEDPYGEEPPIVIYNGFDKETYEKNAASYEKAMGWFSRYVNDPDADPIKKAAYEHQLWMIQNVHMVQAYSPEAGKLIMGRADPFNMLVKMASGFADIPEYTLEMVGGKQAHDAMASLVHYANVRNIIANTHPLHRVDASTKAAAAAKEHKLSVIAWKQKIGDEILGSYQNRGDRRLAAGDKVNGYTISEKDMDAVRASKQYVDAIMEAVRKIEEKTILGKAGEVKIRDVIGKRVIERKAQDTTGLTVPQRLKRIAVGENGFVERWRAISRDLKNRNITKEQATRRYFDLVNEPIFFESAVLSHLDSYSNPQYAADNPSVLRSYYRTIAHKRHYEGVIYPDLESVADEIFGMMAEQGADEQFHPGWIAETILKEVGKAVDAFANEELEKAKLVGDETDVQVVTATNFVNRPRSKRILPKGFYEYTVATNEEQNGVGHAILEVQAQRYLKKLTGLQKILQAQVEAFAERVRLDPKAAKEIRQEQINGEHFLNYREAERLLPMVNRLISSFRRHIEATQEEERDQYTAFNISRGLLVGAMLQKAGVLLRNYMGNVLNQVILDQMMLRQARSWLTRIPFVSSTYAMGRGAIIAGKAAVEGAVAITTSRMFKNKTGEEIVATLAKHKDTWGDFAGTIYGWLAKLHSDTESLRDLGIIERDPVKANIRAYIQFFNQGGRISNENLTGLQKFYRGAQSTAGLVSEIGFPFMLPRRFGSQAVDRLVNSQVVFLTDRMTNMLKRRAKESLDACNRAGYDPFKSILTPEEVFGRKGASERDLAALRSFLGKAGVNLDRSMIQYWQALREAKAEGKPVEEVEILTKEQLGSLQHEVARWMNKSMFSNRPTTSGSLQRFMMTFMGYPLNQNTQMARLFTRFSRDKRKINWRSALAVGELLWGVLLLGTLITFPLAKLLEWWFYKEKKYVKELSDTDGSADLFMTAMVQSAGHMPIVGSMANYALGAATPGSRFSAFGFQLLPISLMNDTLEMVTQVAQTKDPVRPVIEFARAWFPNSRSYINRLPVREGLTEEAAMRATLVSKAPPGVDIEMGGGSAGIRRVSSTKGFVDDIINELSKIKGPDMLTVRQIRQRAIERRMGEGMNASDAAESVDRAVMNRTPYRIVYGRDLTRAERGDLDARLNDDEKALQSRIESGRKEYARMAGRSEPDFIRDEDRRSRAPVDFTFAPATDRRAGVRRGLRGVQKNTPRFRGVRRD